MQTALSDALTHLSQDHITFRRLLNVLDRQIEAIAQYRDPDFDVLGGVLRYFGDYPGRFHHPVEHLLYTALKERRPELADAIEFIEQQHGEVAQQLAAFSVAVENVRAEVEVSRHTFCDAARKFIAFERRHIRGEESSLFYLAMANLEPADWLSIDQRTRLILEPLSQENVGIRFRKLYADVIAWDFEKQPGA